MSIENLQIYPIGKNININSVLMLNNKYQKQTTYAKIIQKFNILIKEYNCDYKKYNCNKSILERVIL